MFKKTTIIGYSLIVIYFYFATFFTTLSQFWTYTFKPIEIKSWNWKKFKELYSDDSNGARAFVYLGSTIPYILGQTINDDFLFKSEVITRQSTGLFAIEEIPFEYKNKIFEAKILKTIKQIEGRANTLKALGAKRIIFVPIPTKISIMYDLSEDISELDHKHIKGNNKLKRNPRFQYNFFVNTLKDKNIEVINLFDVFKKYSAEKEPLYILEDSHLSKYGVKLTGKEIINYLSPNKILKVQYSNIISYSENTPGDLYRRAMLPNWSFLRVNRSNYHTYNLITNPAIKQKKSNYKIILLGTSYFALNKDFIQDLSDFLDPQLLNLTKDGKYPSEVFNNLITNYQPDIKDSIIIWEFPIRYTQNEEHFKEIP